MFSINVFVMVRHVLSTAFFFGWYFWEISRYDVYQSVDVVSGFTKLGS